MVFIYRISCKKVNQFSDYVTPDEGKTMVASDDMITLKDIENNNRYLTIHDKNGDFLGLCKTLKSINPSFHYSHELENDEIDHL